MTLPSGKTYKRSVIIEEAPAWEECVQCEGETVVCAICKEYPCVQSSHSIGSEDCPGCNGSGGRWHKAVEVDDLFAVIVSGEYEEIENPVTKSTILQREWKCCEVCNGFGEYVYADRLTSNCGECQRTGAEPDSQGEWQVK